MRWHSIWAFMGNQRNWRLIWQVMLIATWFVMMEKRTKKSKKTAPYSFSLGERLKRVFSTGLPLIRCLAKAISDIVASAPKSAQSLLKGRCPPLVKGAKTNFPLSLSTSSLFRSRWLMFRWIGSGKKLFCLTECWFTCSPFLNAEDACATNYKRKSVQVWYISETEFQRKMIRLSRKDGPVLIAATLGAKRWYELNKIIGLWHSPPIDGFCMWCLARKIKLLAYLLHLVYNSALCAWIAQVSS